MGLHNEGFLATHEPHAGVPKRADWATAATKASAVLDRRGRDLLAALGFALDHHPGAATGGVVFSETSAEIERRRSCRVR